MRRTWIALRKAASIGGLSFKCPQRYLRYTHMLRSFVADVAARVRLQDPPDGFLCFIQVQVSSGRDLGYNLHAVVVCQMQTPRHALLVVGMDEHRLEFAMEEKKKGSDVTYAIYIANKKGKITEEHNRGRKGGETSSASPGIEARRTCWAEPRKSSAPRPS
ncbi:hypothetical protein CONLIGDRAFT_459463 [Coniochaeta ligniaria NRRL 30616]|uniref:Uncharacterized protein n=1 Tax=Coniochaeta ligniaria NRRL 30616 TaxID=1408157 RepID=A0A1J7IKT8_9PEZI|nr:hypothetical protein CONLIGDRAFT_459463 [Coniochaeta ligniaria NRRL 30616]